MSDEYTDPTAPSWAPDPKPQHTPGPWRTSKTMQDHRNGGGFVTLLSPANDWLGDIRCNSAEEEANAEFIVRACNCHDELLEVLQMIRFVETEPEPTVKLKFQYSHREFFDKARAAIAKAEGRED